MPNKKRFNIGLLVTVALILVIGLWGFNWLLIDWPVDQRGTLGDMFGVVNALFSGLAFAGIILTIYMQKHELEMQRNELEETREVFKTQTELMNHQQYDTTFFSLLDNHRNLIDSLKQGYTQRYSAIGETTIGLRDEISGYAYVEKLVTQWQKTLSAYKLATEDQVLVHPIHTKYATVKAFLDDSPKARNLVTEINHIYLFIHTQMNVGDKGFYNDTLWHNLSESEKFLFELFIVYYPNLRHDITHPLLIYPKYNYPDFNQFELPVVLLENVEVEDDEILRISSTSEILNVRYFTFLDQGKTASVFNVKELQGTDGTTEWFLDLNQVNLSPIKIEQELINPSVGLAVLLQFQDQTYQFMIEIDFDLEMDQDDLDISQNGWKPLSHRLAKHLIKQL